MSFSYEELAEIRYYIHQHPELSGQEYQTTAFLKERLEELGIRILESGLKTGLIAEIGSGQPVVALRADIDAQLLLHRTGLKGLAADAAHDRLAVIRMDFLFHGFHLTLTGLSTLRRDRHPINHTTRIIARFAPRFKGFDAILHVCLNYPPGSGSRPTRRRGSALRPGPGAA